MPIQAWSSGDALNSTNLNNRSASGFQSQTISAAAYAKGTSGVAANDNAVAVNTAIADAVATNMKYVFVPQSMLPYNANLVTFNAAVRMMREEGVTEGIDVKAYGAAGDGVSDDTIAIQSAITQTQAVVDGAGHGITYLPPGTYVINSQLTLGSRITLRGAGARSTIILCGSNFANLSTTGAVRMGDGTAGIFSCIIEDLQINCAGFLLSVGIFSSDLQNLCVVQRVIVNNFAGYGIRFNGSGGATGSVNEFSIRDVSCFKAAVGGVSGIGVSLENGSYTGDLSYIQCTSESPANGLAAGFQVISQHAVWHSCYSETYGTDGFLFGSGSNGGCIGCRVNGTYTNGYHILATAQRVVLMMCRLGTLTSATILDDTGPISVTNLIVPLYIRGTNGTGNILTANDNGIGLVNQTSAAGASTGTLTNAPAATPPNFWLRVTINGVNRFIPCW